MVILQEKGGDDLNFDAFDPKFHRSFVEYPKDNITWNQHIRGLFTWNNAQCMAHSLNLTSYEMMKDNADPVYDMVSQKKMPPGEPWPQEQIEMFRKWKDVLDDDGYPFQGGLIDSDDPNSLIMDPPLRVIFDPIPETAYYYRDIYPLLTFCDQKIAARDYNNIDVKQYEQFKKVASDYNNNKEDKHNIVYDIFNDNFPKGNRWPEMWKTVLTNWINKGFQEGEPTIYDQPA